MRLRSWSRRFAVISLDDKCKIEVKVRSRRFAVMSLDDKCKIEVKVME